MLRGGPKGKLRNQALSVGEATLGAKVGFVTSLLSFWQTSHLAVLPAYIGDQLVLSLTTSGH